jgi:hypothetical protein
MLNNSAISTAVTIIEVAIFPPYFTSDLASGARSTSSIGDGQSGPLNRPHRPPVAGPVEENYLWPSKKPTIAIPIVMTRIQTMIGASQSPATDKRCFGEALPWPARLGQPPTPGIGSSFPDWSAERKTLAQRVSAHREGNLSPALTAKLCRFAHIALAQ